MSSSVPDGFSRPAPPGPAAPIDFATHASQVTAQTSLGNIDTSTANGATHLTSLDTNVGTHLAAIDTNAAHLPTIDTSTAASASSLATLVAAIGLTNYEVQHTTIPHNTDNTITFAFNKAQRIRVSNWSTTVVLLVKKTTISGTSDGAASRVPAAASAISPGILEYVAWGQSTVHLYTGDSGSTVAVTVEGFQ